MKFIPGDAAQEDDNLFWMILEGSRGVILAMMTE